MAEIGSELGWYDFTRGWAKMVDSVLISVKTGQATSRAERDRLASLLLSCSDIQLASRLLALVLQAVPGANPEHWAQVGQELQGGTVSAEALEWLEKLACVLEREQQLASKGT